MIDLKLLREDPDRVRASQRARGEDPALVDALLDADATRRSAISAADNLRAEQKAASKAVGAASADERPALLARAKELAEEVKAAEVEQAAAEAAFTAAHMAISERHHRRRARRRRGRLRGARHRRRAAGDRRPEGPPGTRRVARPDRHGARRQGVRLAVLLPHRVTARCCSSACMQLAVQLATENGFTLVIPPVLVRPEVMAGTGFLGAHADEIYHLEADDLYLVGTSEVPLAGYHSDEILDLSDGPRRYAGWSSCFRREAGSYGKDTRGIIRVHQFDKVEAFVYCKPEDAEAEHQRLLGLERQMLAHIEVPYRVIDIAAGDLGSSAARKFDCEAWVPDAEDLPRADVDVELHHVPGAAAVDPLPRRERQAADRRDAQRHAGHHPLAGRHPGEPPAAGRQRAGAGGAGALRRKVGARAVTRIRSNSTSPNCGPGSASASQATSRGTSRAGGARPPTSSTSARRRRRARGHLPLVRTGSDGFLGEFPLSHDTCCCRKRHAAEPADRTRGRAGLPVVWQGDTGLVVRASARSTTARSAAGAEDQPKKNWGPARRALPPVLRASDPRRSRRPRLRWSTCTADGPSTSTASTARCSATRTTARCCSTGSPSGWRPRAARRTRLRRRSADGRPPDGRVLIGIGATATRRSASRLPAAGDRHRAGYDTESIRHRMRWRIDVSTRSPPVPGRGRRVPDGSAAASAASHRRPLPADPDVRDRRPASSPSRQSSALADLAGLPRPRGDGGLPRRRRLVGHRPAVGRLSASPRR